MTGPRWAVAACGTGGCVAVAYHIGRILVGDTKAVLDGPFLTFSPDEWAAFLADAKAGRFDLDRLTGEAP